MMRRRATSRGRLGSMSGSLSSTSPGRFGSAPAWEMRRRIVEGEGGLREQARRRGDRDAGAERGGDESAFPTPPGASEPDSVGSHLAPFSTNSLTSPAAPSDIPLAASDCASTHRFFHLYRQAQRGDINCFRPLSQKQPLRFGFAPQDSRRNVARDQRPSSMHTRRGENPGDSAVLMTEGLLEMRKSASFCSPFSKAVYTRGGWDWILGTGFNSIPVFDRVSRICTHLSSQKGLSFSEIHDWKGSTAMLRGEPLNRPSCTRAPCSSNTSTT
mmetsp:Transcript_45952/g.90534  ORF Transcript_45952/g.90534 Transcript_45952/m.90534 type:complete len:271 (-) Transcript_45952:497-1309(-)